MTTTLLPKLEGSKAHSPKKSDERKVACVPHAIAAVTGRMPEEIREELQTYRAEKGIPQLTESKRRGTGHSSTSQCSKGRTGFWTT